MMERDSAGSHGGLFRNADEDGRGLLIERMALYDLGGILLDSWMAHKTQSRAMIFHRSHVSYQSMRGTPSRFLSRISHIDRRKLKTVEWENRSIGLLTLFGWRILGRGILYFSSVLPTLMWPTWNRNRWPSVFPEATEHLKEKKKKTHNSKLEYRIAFHRKTSP